MSTYDGGVNHHVFVIGIARQQLEDALKNSTLRPPAEALMRRLPIAEADRQIAPRHTGSKSVQNGFDEQPIICRRTAHMADTAGQKIFDPFPLIVP
jgi:hypothetical protein